MDSLFLAQGGIFPCTIHLHASGSVTPLIKRIFRLLSTICMEFIVNHLLLYISSNFSISSCSMVSISTIPCLMQYWYIHCIGSRNRTLRSFDPLHSQEYVWVVENLLFHLSEALTLKSHTNSVLSRTLSNSIASFWSGRWQEKDLLFVFQIKFLCLQIVSFPVWYDIAWFDPMSLNTEVPVLAFSSYKILFIFFSDRIIDFLGYGVSLRIRKFWYYPSMAFRCLRTAEFLPVDHHSCSIQYAFCFWEMMSYCALIVQSCPQAETFIISNIIFLLLISHYKFPTASDILLHISMTVCTGSPSISCSCK